MITRRGRPWLVVTLAVCLSLLVHVLVLPRAGRWLLGTPADPLAHISFVDADALDVPSMESLKQRAHEASPVVEPPPEPPEPSPRSRQLVETAPTDERRPTDADYLAEQDNRVDTESRTERYKINPDVLAPTYSDASKAPEKAADEVASKAESAPAGALPEVGRSGGPPRSLLPARFQPTASAALTAPTRAGAVDTPGVGAPQNDLLREDVGDSVALNTLEFAGAKYLNQVRRHVNFYWSQQIDNLPPSLDLSRPVYETRVSVVLDRDGALEAFAVTQPSGNGRIDDCIRKAFTMSAPYGAPPPELLGADGRLRLPNFAFTLQIVQRYAR